MSRPPKLSLYKSYRSTFHIFPAMIPLIEILPWLLGLIGGAAGGFEFLREKLWHKKRNRWLLISSVMLISAGGAIYAVHEARLPRVDSSLTVAPENFSRIKLHVPETVQVEAPKAEFARLFFQKTTSQFLGNPIVSGDKLLIGTLDKTLDARRLSDGQRVWSLQKKEPVFTSALVHNGIGVIGEGVHTAPSATVTGFNAEDGTVLWERTFRSHVETAPSVSQNGKFVFQAAGAEGVWALVLKSGEVVWHAPIGHIDVRGHVEDDALFIPAKLKEDEDGAAMFKLDAGTGEVVWQTSIPGNPMGDVLPLGNGDMIVTTAIGQVGLNKLTDRGWVHRITGDGKIVWSVEIPAAALPEGNIWEEKKLAYFALKNGTLIALNTEDGQTAWSTVYGGEFRADAALLKDEANPLIVAVTADGHAMVCNALTGKPVTTVKLDSGAYASPFFHEDKLYLFEKYAITAYGPVSGLVRK